MTPPMPAEMEKEFENWFGQVHWPLHVSGTTLAEKAWAACYEAMMKNAMVVEIPKEGCLFCEFDGITHEYCRAYRDIKTKYKRPDFCKAKSVTIILNEG